MKIKKTTVEKKQKAKEKSKDSLKAIIEKVEEFGEVTVEFGRKDFKKELSTTMGWGFNDMKEKNQRTIKGLFTKGYDVDFKQLENGEIGLVIVVTKNND